MEIAICICFSKKNEKFHHRVLNNLNELEIPQGKKIFFYLIVNENIRNIYDLSKKILKKEINRKILYSPKKNIPASRNVFINNIKKKKIKFIGFLDDDCKFDKKWLFKMHQFIKKNDCDIVGGPQIHETRDKKYKDYYNFLEPKYKDKKKIRWAATNNCFFKKRFLERTGVIFDERLRNIGGSDQLFFQELNRLGLLILWNKNSKVYEYSQSNRENLWWFLRRNFRYGNSGLMIDTKLNGKLIGTLISIPKIFILLIFSILSFLNVFKSKNFILSLFYLSRMAGRCASLLRIKINKYN